MGEFFKLWRSNVLKINKNVTVSDQVNPIGNYLSDLKEYIESEDKNDIKMFSEEEMTFKRQANIDNSDFGNKFDLVKLLKGLQTDSCANSTSNSELNLLLLSRNLDGSKDSLIYNQVLDSLLFCLSNRSLSLYDIQNETKPQLTYKEKVNEITYSLRYRETSLLATKFKKSIKIDLMRVSLLVVFMRDLEEMMNLRGLLDTALPKMAGVNLLLITAGIEP